MKNLKVNKENISKLFQNNRKANVVRVSTFILAITMFLSGCGKKTDEVTATPEPTVAVSEEVLPEDNYEVPAETEEPVRVYSTEEKITFVKENAEVFMNQVNEIPGIALDSNAALIQLGFLNGLTVEQIGASTNDYVLDFITDYENVWNALTIRTMNYLTCDATLDANGSLYGNVYGAYILDNEDKVAYEYFANKTLEILDTAFASTKEEATELAIAKNKLNAETLIYDGIFEGMDIDNVSDEVKYAIRYIAFFDTHFLEERTAVKVETMSGETSFINYDESVRGQNYSSEDDSYTITGNIQNDLSYLIQRDSVNVTMKYYIGPNLCSYTETANGKVRTLSI